MKNEIAENSRCTRRVFLRFTYVINHAVVQAHFAAVLWRDTFAVVYDVAVRALAAGLARCVTDVEACERSVQVVWAGALTQARRVELRLKTLP